VWGVGKRSFDRALVKVGDSQLLAALNPLLIPEVIVTRVKFEKW
jgi:hypothetical protein